MIRKSGEGFLFFSFFFHYILVASPSSLVVAGTIGISILVHGVGRPTPLAQNTADVDILLSLLLDLVSGFLLLGLFPVEVAGHVWLLAGGAGLVVDGGGDFSLAGGGHLLGVEFVVAAHGFVGFTFCFFAGRGAADAAGH